MMASGVSMFAALSALQEQRMAAFISLPIRLDSMGDTNSFSAASSSVECISQRERVMEEDPADTDCGVGEPDWRLERMRAESLPPNPNELQRT